VTDDSRSSSESEGPEDERGGLDLHSILQGMGAASESEASASDDDDDDDNDNDDDAARAPTAAHAALLTAPKVENDDLKGLMLEFGLFSEPLYFAVFAAGGGGSCAHVAMAGELAGTQAGASTLQYRKLHKVSSRSVDVLFSEQTFSVSARFLNF
jgi:hypothetical protein